MDFTEARRKATLLGVSLSTGGCSNALLLGMNKTVPVTSPTPVASGWMPKHPDNDFEIKYDYTHNNH